MSDAASDVDPVREVRRMHTFIEDWIGGIRDDVSPFADALAPEFTFVPPDGVLRDRESAVAAMEDAGGAHADSTPHFVIEIENAERQLSVYGMHLVTYEEYQRVDGDWQARTSSVWLRETADTPSGLEWVHLHESWLETGDEQEESAEAETEGGDGATGATANDDSAADSED